MTHKSTSFRSLLREKHTHDLLALAPKETQMALLSIQENDQLNQFYASGENVGLRRERCRALTTLADLNAVITRVRWSLVCMSRDARRLATVGRWLARSVRRIQQFVRERLAILREKKRALLAMWQSHQRQSKQNLEKVAKDTGLRLRSSQHTVFDQEDLWGLVIDCNIDTESMKEAIESVWHVRKAQYSRVFRETQSERKGQLVSKLNRMSAQQEAVDEVLQETAQPPILLDADSPAAEDNPVEPTPVAARSPSTTSTPPPIAADTTFGDFRNLTLTPLQQKDLQPSDDPKSRWTLWRGAHACAAKISHLPNHPRKSLVIRTMTFRKLRLKRLQFDVPSLKFGVEHVSLAELCAHHKILQIRNVSKNIEQYWLEKQRLEEGMAQAAAIVASIHHEAVANHDRNATKGRQADVNEPTKPPSSNFLDATSASHVGSQKPKLLNFQGINAAATASCNELSPIDTLHSPSIGASVHGSDTRLSDEVGQQGEDQLLQAVEGEASMDHRQSSTKSFISAPAAESSEHGDDSDETLIQQGNAISNAQAEKENDERAVQRSREAFRRYTLTDDEEMALDGLMEPTKHNAPVSYLHALFTLEAKSHWFTLLCLKRMQHGQLDVTPPIGSHATMFEQADEAVRIFKRWGRQLLQPKGESHAPTIDASGQPFPRCGITPLSGRRSPPVSPPRRAAAPSPLSVPMLNTVGTLTTTAASTAASGARLPQPPTLSTKARAKQQMSQWLQTLRVKTGKEAEVPKGDDEEDDTNRLWNAVMEVHKKTLCHAREQIRQEQQKQLDLIHRQHKAAVLGTQAILQRSHEVSVRASSLTPRHQRATQRSPTKDGDRVPNAAGSIGSLSPTQLLGASFEVGSATRPQSARAPHRPDPSLAAAVETRRVMGIKLSERCRSSKSPTPPSSTRKKSPSRKPAVPFTSRKQQGDRGGKQAVASPPTAVTNGPVAAATNVPQATRGNFAA